MTNKKLVKRCMFTILLFSSFNLLSNRLIDASENITDMGSLSNQTLEMDNNVTVTSSMLLDSQKGSNSKVYEYYKIYSDLYSHVTEESILRDDVLFSVSAIHTNLGVNSALDTNEYFPNSGDEIPLSFEDSYSLFITELNHLSRDFDLSPNQTLEEQAQILKEIYKSSNLESSIIQISEFYNSGMTTENVEEEILEAELAEEEIQDTEIISPEDDLIYSDTIGESEDVLSWEDIDNNIVQTEVEERDSIPSEAYNAALTSSVATKKLATKLYKVKSGDTLYKISQNYGVTVQQLKEWNYSSTDTIKVGQFLGVNGYYNDNQTLFSNEYNFISAILTDAKSIAADYNLYTSVMLAQALLESTHGNSELAKISNNIFGIKYLTSNFVEKSTLEYANGVFFEAVQKFEKYNSYRDAILSYSNKIRNGVSWNATIYKNVWPENTENYKDATKALTGVYADDPDYNTKLNKIIEDFNLTQYDNHITPKTNNPEKILTSKYVDYSASVTGPNHTVDTLPWGVSGYKTIGPSSNYLGQTFRITEEKVTGRATWVYLSGLGWMDKAGITPETITSRQSASYMAIIARTTDSISTLPWGVEGFKMVGNSANYLGSTVEVTELAVTPRATWAHIKHNGQSLGWIDRAGLTMSADVVLSTKNVDYSASVTGPNHTVDTLPWGVSGYKTIGPSSNYLGQTFRITEEKVTGRATWVYLSGLGWMDKAGITPETITSRQSASYMAIIARTTDSISTLPWGVEGFKMVGNSANYLGSTVEVTELAVTPRATWAHIKHNGQSLGWIDRAGLTMSADVVLSTKNVDYSASVTGPNHTVDTLPWGVSGYKTIGPSSNYLGQTFRITEEKVTGRATWVYLSGLGWMDKAGITPETITSRQSASYMAIIARTTDSISTLPWGVEGFKMVGNSANYLGSTVEVTELAVTPRATWAHIKHNGQSLGWIDRAGLTMSADVVLSTKNVEYSAKVTAGHHTIDTLPWGVSGYQTVGKSSDYLGQSFKVYEEKVTGRATWVHLAGLGWIDKAGITPDSIITSKNVDYVARIARNWDSITTLPWGVEGYKHIASSVQYLSKSVRVVREATTQRATWALIQYEGVELGWIDKNGLNTKPIIFIDPGHGGTDPGAAYFGVNEKSINLTVSLKLKEKLEKAGYSVIMSRTTDVSLDYTIERSRIANTSGADLFISVHHNALSTAPSAHGIETFWYEYDPNYQPKINQKMHNNPERLAKSALLAQQIHNSLINGTGAFDRGVKRETFAVLRETVLPSVLLELGFMSNKPELDKLVTDSYQEKLAQAIKNGIDGYFRLQ